VRLIIRTPESWRDKVLMSQALMEELGIWHRLADEDHAKAIFAEQWNLAWQKKEEPS